ncbi:hypothetical protein NDU88_004251 [Pleurodeles waltl]|uniref:Uncharacterized protein n=1 Tax=Pleurodeles waltl TaxID=8319 RepID=A0AAV7KZD3_PLEWA|nr:hypothetical protein NDU88_004251 [Pleurodeles waltl]
MNPSMVSKALSTSSNVFAADKRKYSDYLLLRADSVTSDRTLWAVESRADDKNARDVALGVLCFRLWDSPESGRVGACSVVDCTGCLRASLCRERCHDGTSIVCSLVAESEWLVSEWLVYQFVPIQALARAAPP